MSCDTEFGSPRPRPLSGGFWTLLSWLRREDHSSSNESLSSAGSDRTAVSFAFLTPAHYHGSAPPVVVPPPGPPTDTYKQRVRERNLRRQYDRGITLHRKYGLHRGDGISTLPSSKPSQAISDRQERDRRATSECYQRRAAYVPGKRRAPPPPARVYSRCKSLDPTVRRNTRKRPAPQPPVILLDKPKGTVQNNNEIRSMNAGSSYCDRETLGQRAGNDITTGCKSEKYTKKDSKDKIKSEKSFLKQIFENKKRNSAIDITTVKVLPSISELDAQAAEIIENNKLKNSEAINHQTMIQAVKDNCCTKCFRKPCSCSKMSSTLEQNRNKNASAYTQTENNLQNSTSGKNNKIDEKQKLKDMLKEMKDSLPKKTKHENINIGDKNQSSENPPLVEAPTLRIGSNNVNQVEQRSQSASSSKIPQKCRKENELPHVINLREMGNITEESKTKLILNKSTPDYQKPNTSKISQDISCNESKKLNIPLKISTLLNPIYIPRDKTSSQDLLKINDKCEDPPTEKPTTSDQTKLKTAKAVREIILNSDIVQSKSKRSSKPVESEPSNAYTQELKQIKSSANKPGDSSSKTQNIHKTNEPTDKKENSNVEKLSQHLRRRELVNMLEQSIAKGDERTAADAASKLAQLRLSCSVLSFTSHILAEPPKITQQDQVKNIASKKTQELRNSAKPLNLNAPSTSKESGEKSKVVGAVEATAPAIKLNTHGDEHGKVPIKSSVIKNVSLNSYNAADTMASIDVWVEDKEKARGPIKLLIRRSAAVGDLRRQAEQSLGLPSRLQRWIIGRTLCTNDDTPLVSFAGPSFNAPFYLYLVQSATNTDQVNLELANETIKVVQNNETEKKSSEVYKELVQLEREALVPNTEIFECDICMEECNAGDGVVLRECVHSFCKNCLSDVIRHCEEPAVLCPATGCPGELHEREIRALVSSEEYERWLARGLAAAESGTRNAFHCRTRDCSGWALCDAGVRKFPCPVCKHTNCVPCQAIHENQTCEQHRAKLLAAAATDAASETDEGTRTLIDSLIARGEALQCPECSAVITKKWGCDWVKCSACKTEICWVTRGRRWGPGGRGDTTGGCKCGVDGKRCHPSCGYCH